MLTCFRALAPDATGCASHPVKAEPPPHGVEVSACPFSGYKGVGERNESKYRATPFMFPSESDIVFASLWIEGRDNQRPGVTRKGAWCE